jgi:hypothetical protein
MRPTFKIELLFSEHWVVRALAHASALSLVFAQTPLRASPAAAASVSSSIRLTVSVRPKATLLLTHQNPASGRSFCSSSNWNPASPQLGFRFERSTVGETSSALSQDVALAPCGQTVSGSRPSAPKGANVVIFEAR